MVEPRALDHRIAVRTRVVVDGAEHLGESDETPDHVAEVAPDQGEDPVALRAQRLPEQRLDDPVHRVRGPWPGLHADDLDGQAVEGAFLAPRFVDDVTRRLLADSVVGEKTERQRLGRAEVDGASRPNVVRAHAGTGGHGEEPQRKQPEWNPEPGATHVKP